MPQKAEVFKQSDDTFVQDFKSAQSVYNKQNKVAELQTRINELNADVTAQD